MSYLSSTRPGTAWFVAGIGFPLVTVLVELVTALCAETFFDPLPTRGHVAAVLAVPALNFLLWRAARREEGYGARFLLAAGAAMAISFTYTLMMLPILPIALIGILIGLGLLPFAPLLALAASAKLASGFIDGTGRPFRHWLGGVALGFLAMLLVDLPAAATYAALRWSQGDSEEVRRGVGLMRLVGDEEMLLRLCYGADGRATGLLSFAASHWSDGAAPARGPATGAAARELYFRATGRAFNLAPSPAEGGLGARGWRFAFDEDQGGTGVGGRAAGLSLARSRIDGSVAARDNVAYLGWTAVFANSSPGPREARLTLLLPPGAVASRATLWVNGTPREAVIAGRGEARAAYQSVVSSARDPLLVTTAGAGRLLVQAFPIQTGGTLQLRIGVTAPLAVGADGGRSLVLPAIVERNFAVPPQLRHNLWVEGDTPLASSGANVSRASLAGGATRLRGLIADEELAARRLRILAPAISAPSVRAVSVPRSPAGPAVGIVQKIERAHAPPPAALTILVDGSAGNAAAGAALRSAVGRIPKGLPVSLIVASAEPLAVPLASWSPEQQARFEDALAATDFEGGQDNVAALALALEQVPDGAALLWVHGPQPIAFHSSLGALKQAIERHGALPRLVRYQAVPGPAFTIEGARWFDGAEEPVPGPDPSRDLAELIDSLAGAGPLWRIVRAEAPAPVDEARGSAHVARLWAADRVAAAPADGAGRTGAIALARRFNIVTPLSGAVVLETDRQYEENGLQVPAAAEVPTVPEPGTWALIAIVCLLFGWLFHRRRGTEVFA